LPPNNSLQRTGRASRLNRLGVSDPHPFGDRAFSHEDLPAKKEVLFGSLNAFFGERRDDFISYHFSRNDNYLLKYSSISV
jgi:hypothetical protein